MMTTGTDELGQSQTSKGSNTTLDSGSESKTAPHGSNATKDGSASDQELFESARQFLDLGRVYRAITFLFAERKLVVLFLVHFICTMTIWSHFALTKFTEQENLVPEGAPRYWWKRLAPPLEFGSMHAILFQMALIPLTMSRYSISAMSGSILNRFIPLNRAVRIHIHLGYTMVGIVFLAVIFFFAFFGLLCSDGDQTFCDKFTEEIMITGYVILALLLIIGGTSYFRHKIPYEVFYAIHHLVFILYFLTIAHTLDVVQRKNQKQRSQAFKWFSSTLLFYFCDRVAMHLNHKYRARVVASSVVTGRGSKMIILRLRRPALFNFKPGQYAFLRLGHIDVNWHPFSIASGPASSELEFYIEVFGKDSWTAQLWEMLQAESKVPEEARRLEFEVMGPYGAGLANTEEFSHGLAVGAGTGIVPVLSLFKQHVRQLLRLDPATYLRVLGEHQARIGEVEEAQRLLKGSLASKVVSPCGREKQMDASLSDTIRVSFCRHGELRRWSDLRQNMKDLKRETFKASRSIYGVVCLCAMPVFGILLLGLTISWNTVNFDLRYGMVELLEALTVLFQLLFVFVSFFIWSGTHIFAYIDVVFSVISPFADWYYFKVYAESGLLSGTDILTYCLLIGYMTARLWHMTVKPRHTSWRECIANDGFTSLERMEIVWVTRSASLVSQVLPDIEAIWNKLVDAWGEEDALKICRVSVYITDKDQDHCELLGNELMDSKLYQSGAVHFKRPDFCKVIEDHTLELISSRNKSSTILAFCGSPDLAQEIHHEKISNDMLKAVTGHKQHQMDFASESYGGGKKKQKKSVEIAFEVAEEEIYKSLLFSSQDIADDSEMSTNKAQSARRLSKKMSQSSLMTSLLKKGKRRQLTKRENIGFAHSLSKIPTEVEV